MSLICKSKMKSSISSIVVVFYYILSGIQSLSPVNDHVQCLGSLDPATDSCSVLAVEKPIRQKRQLFQNEHSCFTASGVYGACIPLQQCYTNYKLSALRQYQNLFLRQSDTCTYQSSSGIEEIGVCCNAVHFVRQNSDGNIYPPYLPFYPHNSHVPEEMPSNEMPINDESILLVNWSPPLSIHPPASKETSFWPPTQPPRPTYPPGPGKPPPPSPIYPPGFSTTKPPDKPPVTKPTYPPSVTKPPFTKPPNQPSTTKPPYKPPITKPTYKPPITKPTYKPPTTKPTYKPPVTQSTIKPTTKPSTTYPTTASEVGGGGFSECGIKNGNQDQERIVGGHNAEPEEWPWMAAIMTNGRLFCGGSLIDNVHILTAAHCVAHMDPWDVAKMKVHLADYDIRSKADGEHIERKVMKVVRHAGFDPQTLYHDIAVLTLDTPVKFSKNVRPICLPAGKSAYSRRMATVIGWGSLKEMGPTPSILQEVNIPIWENQDCRTKYGSAAPGGIVDSFLCAGKTNKDSCSGDSGGPLMVNDGKWQQVGIVSWGIGCGKGQFPGVYTRMTSYMSWLNKNLKI